LARRDDRLIANPATRPAARSVTSRGNCASCPTDGVGAAGVVTLEEVEVAR